MRHVGEGLLDKLDAALTEALCRIRDGDATKATVTLAFTLAVDDEGEEEFGYTLKAARGAKGEWRPGSGQPRLPFDGKGTGELLAEHLDAKREREEVMHQIVQETADQLNAQGIPATVTRR